MTKSRVYSALIGITGAISNNGKTNNTDLIVARAILCDELDEDDMVDKIHKEKFTIAPNCATCKAPCGNTSDYDIEKFNEDSPEVKEAKELLVKSLEQYVKKCMEEYNLSLIAEKMDKEEQIFKLSDIVYQALTYLGYSLDLSSYAEIAEELKDD